ncbi:MAG: ferredoxin [Bacilli bacterium]|nr:ferredoxin [Bacilli bacterium]
MKKIVLQTESCIGCGACIGIDAEHFEFSDDGFSVIKSQENLDSPSLSDAIDACPVAIISLEETTNTEEACIGSSDETCQEHECHCENCHCHDEAEDEEKAA